MRGFPQITHGILINLPILISYLTLFLARDACGFCLVRRRDLAFITEVDSVLTRFRSRIRALSILLQRYFRSRNLLHNRQARWPRIITIVVSSNLCPLLQMVLTRVHLDAWDRAIRIGNSGPILPPQKRLFVSCRCSYIALLSLDPATHTVDISFRLRQCLTTLVRNSPLKIGPWRKH